MTVAIIPITCAMGFYTEVDKYKLQEDIMRERSLRRKKTNNQRNNYKNKSMDNSLVLPNSKNPTNLIVALLVFPVFFVPLFFATISSPISISSIYGISINESQKYVAELVTLGVAFFGGGLYLTLRNCWPRLPKCLLYPVILYLVALIASLFQTVNPVLGFVEGLEVYLLPLLFFVFALVWNYSNEQVLVIFFSALFAAGIIALIGIAQAYDIGWSSTALPHTGPGSLLFSKNLAAEYLITLIPVSAAIVLMPIKRVFRVISGTLSLLLMLHLVLTTARGAWVGFICGDILALVLGGVGVYFAWRKSTQEIPFRYREFCSFPVVVGLLSLVPFFLLLLLSSPWWIGEESTLSRSPAAQFSRISPDQSSERLEIWQDSLDLLPDIWLSGVGPGHYLIHAPKIWGKTNRRPIRWDDENGTLTFSHRPHNDYLQIWLEMGILGLLAVIFIFTIISWMAVRGIGRAVVSKDLIRALIIKASFAGFIAFSVSMLFEFPFRMPASMVMGWLCAAIAVSFSINGQIQWKRLPTFGNLLAGAVSVLLIVVCFSSAHKIFSADQYDRKANWAWEAGQLQEAYYWGQKAYVNTPWAHNVAINQARTAFVLKRYEEAFALAKEAVEIYPHSLPAIWMQGIAAYNSGKKEEARSAFRQIVTKFPNLREVDKYRNLSGVNDQFN